MIFKNFVISFKLHNFIWKNNSNSNMTTINYVFINIVHPKGLSTEKYRRRRATCYWFGKIYNIYLFHWYLTKFLAGSYRWYSKIFWGFISNIIQQITQHKKWSFLLRTSSVCDQICSFFQIWSHLLKKSLIENFIFCAVQISRRWKNTFKYSPWNFYSHSFILQLKLFYNWYHIFCRKTATGFCVVLNHAFLLITKSRLISASVFF